MALKFSFILSVFLLCGVLAVISSVNSISCFRRTTVNDEEYNDEGAVNCTGADDDRCGTLTYTTESDGSTYDVLIKNCTRSTVDCNQDRVCKRVEDHLTSIGATLLSCTEEDCCDSDLCNAPAQTKDMEKRGKKNKEKKIFKEKLAKMISSRI